MKDLASAQRRELLYRHWCEQVFDPIQVRRWCRIHGRAHTGQAQIAAQIDSETIEELEERKRRDFNAFLEASNTRALFRDIVIPTEYDPMAAHKRTIKYSVGTLADPVKQDMLRVRASSHCVRVCSILTQMSRISKRGRRRRKRC